MMLHTVVFEHLAISPPPGGERCMIRALDVIYGPLQWFRLPLRRCADQWSPSMSIGQTLCLVALCTVAIAASVSAVHFARQVTQELRTQQDELALRVSRGGAK